MSGTPALIWRTWLAALFVVLALAGCAQGQAGAQYAPYAPENNGNMHDSGGGGGGGGGM
jgi:hypothetical protein